MTSDLLPVQSADAIGDAFDLYMARFEEITGRAAGRFEVRDWHGAHKDAIERLDLRETVIRRVVDDVRVQLGGRLGDKGLWARMKVAYLDRINCQPSPQLAETFFSSVTRRIFATEGVDPSIEFIDSEFDCEGAPPETPAYKTFEDRTLPALVRRILSDYAFGVPYSDIERDAYLIAERIQAQQQATWGSDPTERIQMLKPVFYRGKGAYLVGRILGEARLMPIVIALLHSEEGIAADAVLLTEDDVSIAFSFTRSYFHVQTERPRDIVLFLRSIMPAKRIAELYISIGYNKHGKTELYRDFIHHLDRSDDQFEVAAGERGMVMFVFTLPSYNWVFKVIRDQFAYPKTTTRQDVMDRYNLVFKHDRAGRLVDAQEFEHLQFPKHRFSERLLQELQTFCPSTLSFHGDRIAISHLYTERRVTPLNLYVREQDADAARAAVLDYGQSIKDLASTGIFPGDLLLKNFGVTRHGRVIFYDYDELTLLTSCSFRDMPQARGMEEEMDGEPWFYVGPNDIFPEEFINFLGLTDEMREVFVQAHGDLLDARYWRSMQERHRADEIIDIFPYAQNQRLGKQMRQ